MSGLALYGFAISLMVRAHVGVEPWDALALGIARHTGLSFGLLTNVIGAAVLVLWWPLRQRPGLGTLLNIATVGTCAQLGLDVVPAVSSLAVRCALFAAGMLLLAVASGLYIGAGFGPGPRDGLMTGLHARLGVPIWLARTVVEVSVGVTGWLLGGNIGVGTIIFAVGAGPLCALTLPWFAARIPRAPRRPVRVVRESESASGSGSGSESASESASGSGSASESGSAAAAGSGSGSLRAAAKPASGGAGAAAPVPVRSLRLRRPAGPLRAQEPRDGSSA